jgi:hypothetical protein
VVFSERVGAHDIHFYINPAKLSKSIISASLVSCADKMHPSMKIAVASF